MEGFAKECAVVTHYRLKNAEDGSGLVVDPDAKLEEELIVRPTSETIIWDTYRRWIQSYRDLPILVNQWANVVRWEMRTRLFIRTAEFLWQEGHTAHSTKDEAEEETLKILDIYSEFLEKTMAIPVLKGIKSENEKFAGAVETFCVEALMQDGKALQAGTSHFLGQNFAKAFNVRFSTPQGKKEYVWGTSWGVSTRLVGALVMAHSDEKGLVLPPNLAPIQVVMIPIFNNEKEYEKINNAFNKIASQLDNKNISYKIDNRKNNKPGWKFAEYELKGVPIRLALGPKDLENSTLEIFRRDKMEKKTINIDEVFSEIDYLIKDIQTNLFDKAKLFTNSNIREANTFDEFKSIIKNNGGFVSAHWDGTTETEEKIKRETKATIRCIPLNNLKEDGKCIFSNKSSNQRVLFAKAY